MRKRAMVIVCLLMIATFSWIFPIKETVAAPPTTPNNPVPSNNSINIPINANLVWTCSDPDNDPITYDVYFGTSNPPEKNASNITVSRYDLGTLDSDTMYYWQIVAWANDGFSAGSIWNFMTGASLNNPPNTPSLPSPVNNSIGASIKIQLNWTGGDPNGDLVTYDVYFGTNGSPGKVDSNISSTTYDPPGNLTLGTMYYWRIVSWDVYAESRKGPLWHFQTNRAPNEPSNPTPSNGSTNILVSTGLSWIGGDPDLDDNITYDVYFGSINPPPLVSEDQLDQNYDPGSLLYNMTYYWRIISWDHQNASTVGPLWWFTTGANMNLPPNVPSNPIPSNGFQGASVNVNLSWTGGDPNNDPVLYTVYFGTTNPPPQVVGNQSDTFYEPPMTLEYVTIYYWKITAWDNSSASSSGPVWNFTTKSEFNHPPNIPGSPSPVNDSSRVSVNADLSWKGGDPDPGDVVEYDVYFGLSNPPSKKVANQTATSYDPGTMSSLTTYYWKIVAWDSSSNSSTSALFHFTTAPQSSGGGEPPQEPKNILPEADASAGEPYQGFVNESVLFDGSKSHDPDGNITSWLWNFGDGIIVKNITVSHLYKKTGIYTVTLTVTDNRGGSNTDTTICVIRQHNRPPTIPLIFGPTSGTKNAVYSYHVISTDMDNDPLQYTIEWGDSISQKSGFVPNGMNFSVNHSWTYAGRYNLTIVVSDNLTNASSEITIYIDAIQTRGAGYLLDNDGDGYYDAFYSDETHQTVSVQRNGDTYLIDKDGDGAWEYVYNATHGLTSYVEPRKTPGFDLVTILCAALGTIVLLKKRRII